MTFRLKLILSVAGLQIIVLILMFQSSMESLQTSSEQALLQRTQTTAKLFASTTQSAVLSNDLGALEGFIGEVLTNPGIVYARVRNNSTTLAEGGDKAALKRSFRADSNLASADSDQVFDVAADITGAGEIYGRVEIGFSTVAIRELISSSRNQNLGLAVGDLVLMVALTIMLGLYVTRRLHALQDGAKRIARGELGHALDIRGHDELADAAGAFNDMSQKLKLLDEERSQQEKEIRTLNAELEGRVIERTAQLQEANKQLEHQALHDALTGLPNRILFHDRLRSTILAAKRTQEAFALIGVDLDLFKEINDTLGHHAGDIVLQHVANACCEALRDSDTVARMGGDEFVILLPKVTNAENAVKVAQRVLNCIKTPLQIEEKKIEIGASLGIVVFPEHGDEMDELINRADVAMYEAKRGNQGIVCYDPKMGEGRNEAIILKGELRNAFHSHQMVLHYQPKIDFKTQRINGVEALVRWQHPRLGLIYPDKFIGLAEDTGLIKELTKEVVHLALTQIRDWMEAGLQIPMAVNISALNLQDHGFPEWVAGMIQEFKTPAHFLELEVTETAIMTDPSRAIENIRQLAGMGIQVSIDDFGTGYSSMAYLQKLLVAKIKIDRTFVRDLAEKAGDEVIVRSTIELAHNLGLKAVAEGVETEQVWHKLESLGCDSAQGYYMSKPLPSAHFLEWVRESNWGFKSLDPQEDVMQDPATQEKALPG